MSVTKSIGVFGGNGFLGRRICETGVKLGHEITAFSRTGEPPRDIRHQQWAKQVQWEKADIFDSSSYQDKLAGLDTVVHSIGLLFENQSYKKIANSNVKILSDVQNLANSLKGSNPMKRDSTNTYEAIQRDSAVLLADAFLQEKQGSQTTPTFVYISADKNPPLVPSGYITTKREAEFELACKPGLRSIFLRPGIMFEDKQHGVNARDVVTNLLKVGYFAKNKILGNNISYVNQLVRPTVSTDKVALKLYEKLADAEFKGVVTLEEIYNS